MKCNAWLSHICLGSTCFVGAHPSPPEQLQPLYFRSPTETQGYQIESIAKHEESQDEFPILRNSKSVPNLADSVQSGTAKEHKVRGERFPVVPPSPTHTHRNRPSRQSRDIPPVPAVPPVPPLPQIYQPTRGNLPTQNSQYWEYNYTILLTKQLFDHLLAREEDNGIREMLLQEKRALERLIRYKFV